MTTLQISVNELKKEMKKDIELYVIRKEFRKEFKGSYIFTNTECKYGVEMFEHLTAWIEIISKQNYLNNEEIEQLKTKGYKWLQRIIDNEVQL